MRALVFLLTALIAISSYAQSGAGSIYGEHGFDTTGKCITCDSEEEKSSRQTSEPKPATAMATPDRIQKILQMLPPGETKQGLIDYYKVLGFGEYENPQSVGTQNAGLAKHFEGPFVKRDNVNMCVRDAVIDFYNEIAQVMRSHTPSKCESLSTPDYGCSEETVRPALNQRAGEGAYKNYPKGWVWQLAMKHAKGDPNAAMYLIGTCGHDDIGQGAFQYVDKSEKALQEIAEERATHQNRWTLLNTQLEELNRRPDQNKEAIYKLSQRINYERSKIRGLEGKTSISRTLSCPYQESSFYAPQSLHASADIPEALKDKIQKVQAEVDGVSMTPGKYYHVYGAAFMACQLIQSGYSPAKASFVQQQAARFYRGVRMCEVASSGPDYQGPALKELVPYMARYRVKNIDSLVPIVIARIQKGDLKCSENVWEETHPLCRLVVDVGYLPEMLTYVDAAELTNAAVNEKMREWRRDDDAAQLYRSWYMGGKVGNISLPCTDIRVVGPEDLMNPSANFFGRMSKPLGWSEERYQDASRKLATWDADFEWTIAQHKAGAEYAGKVCKKRGPNEPPFAALCPAEGGAKSSGSTSPAGGAGSKGVQ